MDDFQPIEEFVYEDSGPESKDDEDDEDDNDQLGF
jgi:hypothetical protein